MLVAIDGFLDRVDLTLGDLGDRIEAAGEAIESTTETLRGVRAGDAGSIFGLGERSHRGDAANSRIRDEVKAVCIGSGMILNVVGVVRGCDVCPKQMSKQ